MRIITFDIETIGEFRNGPRAFENLELTICCIHDSETDSYDSFLKEDLPRLWKIFEHTDALVGFNSDHFDIPILNKYYPGDLSKIRSIDLLKEISAVLGRRVRLDAVAEGTLDRKRAPPASKQCNGGRRQHQKLREYA